jgi:hypothetical protein
MVFQSRPFALVFRLVAVVLIATGLVRLMWVPDYGMAWSALIYYTGQSNALCLIWMGVMAGVTVRDIMRDGPRGLAEPWPRLGAMVMMAITVTMLIYLIVLVPTTFVQDGSGYRPFTLTDDLIHIVTPCLTILDWFLFSPKGRLRLYDPVLWAAPPYVYLAFAFTWPFLTGALGEYHWYPYPFMDVGELGLDGVAIQLLVLTISLIAFGYVYVGADKLLARFARRQV